jgi:hypothetical protein
MTEARSVADVVAQAERIAGELERISELCRRIEAERWTVRLAAAPVRPGQRGDGLLAEESTKYTKASESSMDTIFAPLTRVERRGGMLLVEATARVAGGVTAAALRKIAERTLQQMHNAALPAAGSAEDVGAGISGHLDPV